VALEESPGVTVVGSTTVGTELHRFARATGPDVVLLNAATHGNWIEAVRCLAGSVPHGKTPRVIVIAGADIEDLLQAVWAGAAGILLRNVSVEELGYAVRHVAAGHSVISPAVTSDMLARLRSLVSGLGREIPGLAAVRALSRREREILAGLASGRSNAEIAYQTKLTVATVKSHVSRILTKLAVRDRVQAALLGQRAGVAAEFEFRDVA
jgi:DNA-binding NarL/FixJ family response regulator